jgi:hypothetical protein
MTKPQYSQLNLIERYSQLNKKKPPNQRKFYRGVPRPQCRGPRPQVWLVGPDAELHQKYRVWAQQKNQAQWRDEGWTIEFDTWCSIWGDMWQHRGREKGTYCMSRLDWSLPWTPDNVAIITREEHAKMQGHARAAGWCSLAQKRYKQRKKQTTETETE